MSESMSCWICATIESALDDMAVLLLHNRWVVLPIIAQSRRSFNATMFTCRFRIRPHGLWSHSYAIGVSRDDARGRPCSVRRCRPRVRNSPEIESIYAALTSYSDTVLVAPTIGRAPHSAVAPR